MLRDTVYIVAEIGINHNGNVEIAKKLIDVAVEAGVDAVKFQKRTPELCVPEEQKTVMRDTPWGYITYLEYKERIEFGRDEYKAIDKHCKERGIPWFASVWDWKAVGFMEQFDPIYYKIPSALITDYSLLRAVRDTSRQVIASTGMSTMNEIRNLVDYFGGDLILCHSTSTYPCPPEELNLNMIHTLQEEFSCPIGYSGHEVGLVPSAVAVALGACLVERHITLDRTMWGTDHAASVEPQGLRKLVKYIRVTEQALGDGVKKVYESEIPVRAKLRG
jgi:N-acetylneuraminate synthase